MNSEPFKNMQFQSQMHQLIKNSGKKINLTKLQSKLSVIYKMLSLLSHSKDSDIIDPEFLKNYLSAGKFIFLYMIRLILKKFSKDIQKI